MRPREQRAPRTSVWGCVGKVGFTFAEAQRKAQRALRRTEEAVQAYRCKRCGRWHIGHTSSKW